MRKFFFACESPRPLAAMRIGLGVVFFFYFAARWPYVVELYSSAGLAMPLFPDSLPRLAAANAAWTILLSSLLLFALAAVACGWQTRLSLAMALILSTWLGLLDGVGTFKKYSVIGLHLLLLLSFSNCGTLWSVDRWLSRRRFRREPLGGLGNSSHPSISREFSQATTPDGDDSDNNTRYRLAWAWPRRLMQILVCSIYWGAAITKMRIQDYSSGDFLMFSLLDDQWGGGQVGLWLATEQNMLVLSSMATLLFEIAFPLLVWVPRLRLTMLGCAVVFHVTAGTVLYLSIFSPVMLVALLAFVNDRDLDRVQLLLRTQGVFVLNLFSDVRRPAIVSLDSSRSPSSGVMRRTAITSAAYFAIAGLWIGTGFLIQYLTDPYEVFHPAAKTKLTAIDQGTVDRMLAAQLPAYTDYFHRFAIGSRVSNYGVRGARKLFHKGNTVYGFARLIQKHPALQLDWLLIAPDGREAGRLSRRLEDSYVYATAGFELKPDLPSGRYRVILQADGHEVADESFQLIGSE